MKRIVKLIIKEEDKELFKSLFKKNKPKIMSFEGCHHVELLEYKEEENIFFTFSIWDSEDALNNYRKSEVFKGIWATTKNMFDGKPEAWSVEVAG